MNRIIGLAINEHVIPRDMDEFRKGFSFNTGNLLFSFAAELLVGPNFTNLSWGADPEVVNKGVGPILMPMANHIGRHFDILETLPHFKDIEARIAIIGLGAQFDSVEHYSLSEVPKGTFDWIRMVSEKSPGRNIGVRGEFTKRILEESGLGDKSVVIGCPSLFISPDINLGQRIRQKFRLTDAKTKYTRLGIAAGTPNKKNNVLVERSLIRLVNEFGAMYIVQNPKSLIEITSGWISDENSKYIKLIQKQWMPNMNAHEIVEWFIKNARVYISVQQWIYDLSRLEFCVGTRIHGVQAAIQAGTPAVCICVDSRTRELCDLMRIPSIDINNLSESRPLLGQLLEVFEEWDGNEFDKNRMMLAKRTHTFLRENEFKVSSHLSKMVKH